MATADFRDRMQFDKRDLLCHLVLGCPPERAIKTVEAMGFSWRIISPRKKPGVRPYNCVDMRIEGHKVVRAEA